ncbi:MAG: outer membrane protein assembly factor [Pseudomonadales bacterium]|nr:outer membrane protein assembly factor [Pseudomonadales bacterium]
MVILAWLVCGQQAIADVRIDGLKSENDDAIRENVLAHLRVDDESCDADAARVRYRFGNAREEIREALQPFGYYSAEISAQLEFPEDACWLARFAITLGKPVRISATEIAVVGAGAGTEEFAALLDRHSLKPGTQLSHKAYESLKSQLLITAREYGYFDARLVKNRMAITPHLFQAQVELVLDTGPRYSFGELYIESDSLSPDLIRRYVDFRPQTPFEQRRLRKLHNDLVTGEYFQEVDIRTVNTAQQTVDVHVKLTRGRRLRYGVGLGFGTDTGVMVRGDFVSRWVNARGHRLELDTRLSTPEQSATFDYRIPGKRPQRDWYSIYGGYHEKDTDAIRTTGWKLGVRDTRFHSSRWSSSRFLENVVDRYEQDGDWQEQQTLVPGYVLTYQVANATERPTQGLRLSAEVLGGSDALLSDVTFARFKVGGKVILPVTKRGRLLVRGETGWMETDNFDGVPPTWRFFAGGDSSVRGYDYQSLGPVDEEGKSLGGERLLTFSAEMDWQIWQGWSGALFADAGNVGKNDLLKDIPWSVGMGARWYSPLGPIRLDLAFPQSGDGSFRIHVSMGPDL